MKRNALALSAVAMLALGACSSSNETSTSSSTTAGGSGTSAPATTPGTTAKAGCTNALEIVNSKAAEDVELEDREIDVETAWADEGPHPDNTVDYDKSLEGAIAEFEIPYDDQFGYSIPVGTPDAPDGKLYVSFSLQLKEGDKIAAGQTFVDSTSKETGDGEINFYAAYLGEDRLLPGEPTITITEITDEQVCGTIESVTKTDLQTFVGIEGTFALDRIQALEAEMEASESGGTTGTTKK